MTRWDWTALTPPFPLARPMQLPHVTITALFVMALVPAQTFQVSSTMQTRYVDFHRDLDRSGVVVVIGNLGKMKEGKRQRLKTGKLGGGGVVQQISGTQYFKVPVKTTIKPRITLTGKAQKLRLEFEIQLSRLPDGSDHRQLRTGNAVELSEDTLAMFVVAPALKGKKGKNKKSKALELLHVIPFDAKYDKGPDAGQQYADTMRDFYDVNRHVADIEAALADFDAAIDDAASKSALRRMQKLMDKQLEMRITKNDRLLQMYVTPLEARMKKRLAATTVKGDDKD